MADAPRADIVGEWTERKLQILDEYLARYCLIMQRQRTSFTLHYVDAFANIGHVTLRRDASQQAAGSVRIALKYPFHKFWFIEREPERAAWLRQLAVEHHAKRVEVLEGDANDILPRVVLPSIRYDRFERAFVFIDPYKLNVLIGTIDALAANRAVESVLNLPIMDTNRRVLPRETHLAALDTFMKTIADVDIIGELYAVQGSFSGDDQLVRGRLDPERLAQLYRRWLAGHGFSQISDALVVRNTINAPLYALIYAGHNKAGSNIIDWLLKHTKQSWVGRAGRSGAPPGAHAQPGLFEGDTGG